MVPCVRGSVERWSRVTAINEWLLPVGGQPLSFFSMTDSTMLFEEVLSYFDIT
jgi:hypothetical protein